LTHQCRASEAGILLTNDQPSASLVPLLGNKKAPTSSSGHLISAGSPVGRNQFSWPKVINLSGRQSKDRLRKKSAGHDKSQPERLIEIIDTRIHPLAAEKKAAYAQCG